MEDREKIETNAKLIQALHAQLQALLAAIEKVNPELHEEFNKINKVLEPKIRELFRD